MLLMLIGISFATACEDKPFQTQARRLQAQGKNAESLKPLNRMLRIDPDDPGALYLKGVALNRLEKREGALRALKRAGKNPDWIVQAGTLEVEIHFANGDPAAALEVTNRVLAKKPESRRGLVQRARARAALGVDMEGGLEDVAAFRKLRPDSVEIFHTHASLLTGLGRFEESAGVLGEIETRWLAGDEAINNETGMLERWCAASARLAVASGNHAKPAKLFGYCLREYRDSEQIRSSALDFYIAANMHEPAEAILIEMIEEKPTALKYRLSLAEQLMARGARKEATRLLRESERILEGEAKFQILWALVEHYEAASEYAQAAGAIERAMKLQADPRLPFRLVDVLVRDGQLVKAMELAEQLEGQVYVDLGMGRVLLEQGRPREALVRFESGLEVWPENAAAHYYAAKAAEQLGETEMAIASYREAVRVDPEGTKAADELARLVEGESADSVDSAGEVR